MRPTIAQTGGPRGPIWCFTSKNNGIARALDRGDRAIATFVPKDHDLLATVHRSLSIDRDRAAVDRLWSRFIAAWLEGGKGDANLPLLRLEPEGAEIRLHERDVVTGVKMLLGIDPQEDYADRTTDVSLRGSACGRLTPGTHAMRLRLLLLVIATLTASGCCDRVTCTTLSSSAYNNANGGA